MLPVSLVFILVVIGWVIWRQTHVVTDRRQPTPSPIPRSFSAIRDRERVGIKIANREIDVEVVNQPTSITLGLGGRPQLGADGMLFVLPRRQVTQFWMKGMVFDIDIIWIKNHQVVKVDQHVPAWPLTTAEAALPLYPSPGEVDMVLEVEAGNAVAWQIVPGANLELK